MKNFFEDLYSCPPKFRVKWNSIDELHEDIANIKNNLEKINKK